MKPRLASHDGYSTFPAARCGQDDDEPVVPDDSLWFAFVLRAAFPVKAEAALLEYSPTSAPRSARAYKRGDRMPSATVLRDLVRGKEGFIVLTQIMAANPPAWWINLQAELKIAAQARAFHKQLNDQLRE